VHIHTLSLLRIINEAKGSMDEKSVLVVNAVLDYVLKVLEEAKNLEEAKRKLLELKLSHLDKVVEILEREYMI